VDPPQSSDHLASVADDKLRRRGNKLIELGPGKSANLKKNMLYDDLKDEEMHYD
jgi:hypothetical protein